LPGLSGETALAGGVPLCVGTHQGAVNATHLDYYLDEYTFRFNRRTSGSRGLSFFRLVQQAVDLTPVPAKDIVGGRVLQKTTTG
jgi:hypothetical protein